MLSSSSSSVSSDSELAASVGLGVWPFISSSPEVLADDGDRVLPLVLLAELWLEFSTVLTEGAAVVGIGVEALVCSIVGVDCEVGDGVELDVDDDEPEDVEETVSSSRRGSR